jgi:hypothetical protein
MNSGAEAHPPLEKEQAPADEAELKNQIERTREQLGETVDQLTAKADVKDRTRITAAQAAGRVRSQLQERVARVRAATPDPARRAAAKVTSSVRRRPAPSAIAAASLIAGLLAFRWSRKR